MQRVWCALILALTLGACKTTDETNSLPEGGNLVESLERKLLEARWIHFGFDIKATGALSAHVKGDLWLGQEGEVRLRFDGRFQGRPVDTEIVSDGILLRHSDPSIPQRAAPLKLHQAFVIGLTRMGLLHNIAVSFSGRAPDHGLGDVKSWLTLSDVVGAPENHLSFDLSVGGKPSASCQLELSPLQGLLPMVRHQEVVFSETDKMQVIERYFNFTCDNAPAADLFGQ
ncbi:MAG: hypothetical protein ACI97A_000403 [Planctomycetota bacterium]|jgi:hypothetical protein